MATGDEVTELKLKRNSFEPDLNQRPKDVNFTSTVLRSTNWAIEGTPVQTTFLREDVPSCPSLQITLKLFKDEKNV